MGVRVRLPGHFLPGATSIDTCEATGTEVCFSVVHASLSSGATVLTSYGDGLKGGPDFCGTE